MDDSSNAGSLPKSYSEPNLYQKIKAIVDSDDSESIVESKEDQPGEEELWENSRSMDEENSSPNLRRRTILLALDNSNMAEKILDYTLDNLVDLSRDSRDVLHLLSLSHFDTDNILSGQEVPKLIEKKKERKRTKVKRRLKPLERKCEEKDIAYITDIRIYSAKYNAGDIIVTVSKQTDCDLLVVGNHRFKFPKKLVHKSVSKTCMERCTCPVMIIR